jgi:hypothetical protein
MRVHLYVSPGKFREENLVKAIAAGVRDAGDQFSCGLNSVHQPVLADVAVMIGMKSADLRQRCVAAGQRVLTFDKGYDRKEDWWRVAIDRHQPTDYLPLLDRPADRRIAARWRTLPWRANGQFVLIAGGGAKYHSVWNLSPVAQWAQEMVDGIRAAGWQGDIQYRPKPSQPDKTVPAGSTLSAPKHIVDAMKGCHAVVTFGSNACFEAVCQGVPAIVLGDAVMRPISSTSLAEVCAPRLASVDDRLRILNALAFCQFREGEWSAGKAWPEVKRQLEEVPAVH